MSKTKPTDGSFVESYLPALLAQASHLISQEFHQIVTRKGMTVSEWRVLASLAHAEPMSIGGMARIAVRKPAGSRQVADLIELANEHERRVLEPFGIARSQELKKTLKQMIELHDNLAEIASGPNDIDS